MLHLLLVSTQAKIITMSVCELDLDSKNDKTPKKNESKILPEEEKILCSHCMRSASNGIRCLGMCVADNDYQKD